MNSSDLKLLAEIEGRDQHEEIHNTSPSAYQDRRTLLRWVKEMQRERDDLQRLPQPLVGFIPQTYGDAIGQGWIQHGDCPSHEWDNRTSAGNARWMLERRASRIADLERLLKVRTEALENISTVRVQDYLPAHRAVAYCRDVAIAALSQGTGGT